MHEMELAVCHVGPGKEQIFIFYGLCILGDRDISQAVEEKVIRHLHFTSLDAFKEV